MSIPAFGVLDHWNVSIGLCSPVIMKTVAQNRRARFDYDIVETVEAGIVLTGPEVKSCRAGHVSLAGAYVLLQGGKAILRNMTIAPYRYASGQEHLPTRERTLLLNAEQLRQWDSSSAQKGMTVIPLEVRAGKYIKIVIGLCRGRKKFDKRSAIKKREVERRLREGREV